jgi:hypothetical protein
MSQEIKLPPLSEPAYRLSFYGEGGKHDFDKPGYTEDQMKAYATQAVESDRAARGEPVAGWKMVPIEPTKAMIDAYVKDSSRFFSARSDWSVMLAAAPSAPAQQPLTDEQIFELAEPFGEFQFGDAQGDKRLAFARAIEAAHNIGAKP